VSGVKANWHVQRIEGLDDEPDPFSAPIEEIGERIDLRDPKAALEVRLRELLGREANLFGGGLTCPIKDRPDSTCHACPVSKAHDTSVALSALCRIGREQETVLTELAVLTCRVE
jgi:hypothetical protein